MKIRGIIRVLFLIMTVSLFEANSVLSATLEHKQTMTSILQEDQFTGWPVDYETSGRSFGTVTTSSDGARIAFTVVCSTASETYVHTYAANPDGTGVIDLTGGLPGTVASNSVTFLQLDEKGDRLFFRSPRFGNYTNIYYFNIDAQTCAFAVVPEPGNDYALTNFDFRKPYSLTTLGDQIYLYFKHNAGWDDVAERNNRGIFTAALGGTVSKITDIDQLTGEQNLNFLDFLGSGADSSRNIFAWNVDYYHPPAEGMYKTDGPTRVPDEAHTYVWPAQDIYQHLISADGTQALYQVKETTGPRFLYSVDLATGAKTLLNETTDLNGYMAPTLCPSGQFAFFSTAGHKRTRVNPATGDQRDTFSDYFTESKFATAYTISDITSDDRLYFIASKWDGGFAKIHRIDMAPTDFSRAPDITSIAFSPSVLLNDGTSQVTVTATVSDAQGPGTISWVRLRYLVDGLEKPAWLVSDPISYSWDLYDDGVNGGDQVAGDGIFTNNTVKAKLTSNFYEEFQLPKDLGIRVVARDEDYNYVLADTVMSVGPLFVSRENLEMKPGEIAVLDITGSGGYTVLNSDTGVATAEIDGTQLRITAIKTGSTTITVGDGSDNTVEVFVRVFPKGGALIPAVFLLD